MPGLWKIMVNFDCVYNIINDEEKRNVVTALIKEIEIYRNDESEYPLKRIISKTIRRKVWLDSRGNEHLIKRRRIPFW